MGIEETILKKALGYEITETVEEYAIGEDGSKRLIKLKESRKHIPPDLSAARVVLDEINKHSIEKMTDSELSQEKQRLLTEIEAQIKSKKKRRNQVEEHRKEV